MRLQNKNWNAFIYLLFQFLFW